MTIFETARLILRRADLDDAEFVLDLLNDPAFLRHIGDKGVRTLEEARDYLRKGPLKSYERFGFGLWLAVLKAGGTTIGLCGLVRRDTLDDVDIGFAFLPQFRSQGYAFEAAEASLAHGRAVLGLARIVAIVSPDNSGSIRVLEKIGLRFERMIRLSINEPEIKLFS